MAALIVIAAHLRKNTFILFIYLVLVVAHELLSCGMQTLSCGVHVRSSSLIRDRTWDPCIGSAESYPLRHQGSPRKTSKALQIDAVSFLFFFKIYFIEV